LKEGDKIWRNRQWIKAVISKKREIVLKEGDVVERKLQNGDWVVLNRQPSLRAESMRAKKVRIIPGKTFRFNLASTEAYNADFDGDKL
jgi:DNA-directed RNA polymerase beta' subunit